MKRQYKKPTIKIIKFKCKSPALQVISTGEGGAESRQYRSTWDDKE